MYCVEWYDDLTMDTIIVFRGSLADCRAYVAGEYSDEYCIIAPDGFTEVE